MASYSGDQIKVRVMGFEDTALPGQPTSTGQKTAANSTSVVGASTTPTKPLAVNVTTSATKIRAASGTPVRVTITNDSANILYIGLANTVTATDATTKGLAIAANGGAIVVPWQVDIWGIFATGSSYVAFMEEN